MHKGKATFNNQSEEGGVVLQLPSISLPSNTPKSSRCARFWVVFPIVLIVSLLVVILGLTVHLNLLTVHLNDHVHDLSESSDLVLDSIKELSSYGSASSSPSETSPNLGLVGYDGYSWRQVLNEASGSTVNVFLTGGFKPSKFFNQQGKAELMAKFNITVVLQERNPSTAVPFTQTSAILDYVNATRIAGGPAVADMVWINGNANNYARARNNGMLYGPWANKVPNAVNFDWNAPRVAFDFGIANNGFEMPFNAAQFVFLYNKTSIANSNVPLPQSMTELVTWINANPGRFTYVDPNTDSSGLGSCFIRHFFYEFTGVGGYAQYYGAYNDTLYKEKANLAFLELRKLNSNLYKAGGEGPYFCANEKECHNLLKTGQIDFSMSYDINAIATQTLNTSLFTSYVPASGTISNLNNFAIFNNAPNKLGALVVGNYMGSMGAMFYRRSNANLTNYVGYDINSAAIKTGGWDTAFAFANSFNAPGVVSTDFLRFPYALPEIDGTYDANIRRDWVPCVQSGLFSQPPCAPV